MSSRVLSSQRRVHVEVDIELLRKLIGNCSSMNLTVSTLTNVRTKVSVRRSPPVKILMGATSVSVTVLEKPGTFMLAPIYRLLFKKHQKTWPTLELTEDQITISYKTYKADKKSDMQEIFDRKLAPGENLSFRLTHLYFQSLP